MYCFSQYKEFAKQYFCKNKQIKNMRYKIYLLKKNGRYVVTPVKYIYFVGMSVPVTINCSSNEHYDIDEYVRAKCDELMLDYDNIEEVNDKKF